MSTKRDGAGQEVRVPLSAIYRQLDDHLGPDEAPYDVETGLNRLTTWMDEEASSMQDVPRPEPVMTERLGVVAASELSVRLEALERTGFRRRMSALITLITVVAFSLIACAGLLFGLPHVPATAAVPLAVTIGAVDAVLAGAVAYIHRTRMGALRDDLHLAFGSGERSRSDADNLGRETDTSAAPNVTKAPALARSRPRVGASPRWEMVRFALDSSAQTARLVVLLVTAAVPVCLLVFLLHR